MRDERKKQARSNKQTRQHVHIHVHVYGQETKGTPQLYFHVQYASKKKLPINGPLNGPFNGAPVPVQAPCTPRSAPVQAPFAIIGSPVRVFVRFARFFALLNF